MQQLEEIVTVIPPDYNKPLKTDYQSFQYNEIESCDDYSYGVLIHKHYKTPYVYATRFEGVITPIITKDKANKLYRAKLEEILEIIRQQSNDNPFI